MGLLWSTFIVIWFGKVWFSAIAQKIVFRTRAVFVEMLHVFRQICVSTKHFLAAATLNQLSATLNP